MDRTTLMLWASGAALVMFTLGWAACWFWQRLRLRRSHPGQDHPAEMDGPGRPASETGGIEPNGGGNRHLA